MLGRRQEFNLQLQQISDAILLFVGLLVGHWLRGDVARWIWPEMVEIPPFSESFWLLAVVCPFLPLMLEQQGYYRNVLGKRWWDFVRQMAQACTLVGLMVAFCEVILHWRAQSRAAMLIGLALGVVFLLTRIRLAQLVLHWRIVHGYADKERVVVAGHVDDIAEMLETMPAEQRAEMEVVGMFDVMNEPVEELVKLLHDKAVSRVVFTVRHAHFHKIEAAVQACEVEGVEAWLGADFFQTSLARPGFDMLGGRLMLVFRSTPTISWELWLKDVIDRLGALSLLVLSLPLWLVAMIGIKVSSPGPVFFVQERAGRHGRSFKMLKFRTMEDGAQAKQEELAAKNQMSGPVFKVENDPRIFKFGRWLRRLSIDELPQLVNVLRGEMSLVGPRPLPTYEIQRIEKHSQRRRLSMKPGLTCLWQVSGRNKIKNFEDWVALDLRYIDDWSLWLDVKILFRTLPAVLRGGGAH
ncbi:sugar transferase [Phragmitibacter flavus]|uniref:Sugar transferase n=2 Tax=Phragmitibacter flavus TaxID=2576071 RepID=A0A5R8KKL9_9BACT|nr:sugar transferase [Phragmitibacter flavus]